MRIPTIPMAGRRAAVALLLVASAACSDFLTVKNPNVIDASTIDPVQDAVTLANSGQQNFQSSLGWLIMYGSWFTGEALVAETFPTRNEFGRREVVASNTSHSGDVWFPLSQSAASNHFVAGLALPTPDTNINLVRAHTWLGYSFVLMAEMFCQGAVYGGPALTTNDMLDSAIANFTAAITKGTANGTAAAVALANVSRVGRARANLQRGNATAASTDAASVPAGFTYSFNHIDDAGNRTRLSNRMWQFTFDRGSISVAPAFRVTDPASVLTEFMRQKHLDFWLEGQRFGDWRRNPAAVTDVPVAGSTYFKPGFSPVGNQTCYPLPLTETDNNPNFP